MYIDEKAKFVNFGELRPTCIMYEYTYNEL